MTQYPLKPLSQIKINMTQYPLKPLGQIKINMNQYPKWAPLLNMKNSSNDQNVYN